MAAAARAPKKLSTGTGRILEDWPPIPEIPQYRVEAVLNWLHEHRNMRRQAITVAWVLCVACELHDRPDGGYYWPARRRLANAWAEWKGETVADPTARAGSPDSANPRAHRAKYVDSIDSAVNSALSEGEVLEDVYETRPGAHRTRGTLHRHRYLIPTRELLLTYRNATRGALRPTGRPRLVASN